ncbi:MAG: single-stranded-DNA-specific exonuclease RecJ [Clostridia bacterium]|nr:single-stranded-DNA-specific exonuclease RecJ [Clostridia bacterium]
MEAKKRERVWTLHESKDDAGTTKDIRELALGLQMSELCAKLLYNRGFRTVEQAQRFLKNEETQLHDPFLLKDADLAVARIRASVERHEKTVIYGDYDVDGVTAVSVLYLYLKSLGADVSYYIPSRSGEGYGLSRAALDRLKAEGVQFIITVDTGITANEEADYATEIGLDMVITDHHECRTELPRACAVVNPHRPDCPYPFKELAGVGVIFKIICAFEMDACRRAGRPAIDGVRRICYTYADLTAIGTIADVMPLVDENRLIVALGLRLIAKTERLGLSALIDASTSQNNRSVNLSAGSHAAPRKKKITSSLIGYGIAPRINAAGRISSASKAVELLLAEEQGEAVRMAQELCEINRMRQVEENRIAEQAYRRIEQSHDFTRDRIIVLEDNGWQQGIIGIVSSRITEKYGLPSILISFDGNCGEEDRPGDVGKGSGRSIKGLNLVEAMTWCEDLLVKYGGHELAAGLTIERGQVDAFRRRINDYAARKLDDSALAVQMEADCEVRMSELTMSLAQELSRMEPYGVANPTPAFVMRDATVQKIISISGGKHTKLLISGEGISMYGMYFGTPADSLDFSEGDHVDILFHLDVNEFQNIRSLQMIVQDIKPSERYHRHCDSMQSRYESIRSGGSFDEEEDIIPVRDDFALVYTVIRREFRMGHDRISDKTLLSLVNSQRPGQVNYIKLQYILLILHEMKVCGVERQAGGINRYSVYFNAGKTNLEKSSILHKLRSQCRNRSFSG